MTAYEEGVVELRCPSCDVELLARYGYERHDDDRGTGTTLDIYSIRVASREEYRDDHAHWCSSTSEEEEEAAKDAAAKKLGLNLTEWDDPRIP